MAGYLLFIPGHRGHDSKVLDSLGAADLVDRGCAPLLQTEHVGPTGKGGTLACWDHGGHPDLDPVRLYDPDAQTWRPAPARGELAEGRYWIGWETARPPRPVDLERDKTLQGRTVELADGNQWLIPIACQLPRTWGASKSRIVNRYVGYFEAAIEAVTQWLFVSDDGQGYGFRVPLDAGLDGGMGALVAQSLALNYRLNADVLDALELIDSDCVATVLDAITEGAALARAVQLVREKKTEDLPDSTGEPSTPCTSTIDAGAPA